MNSPALSYLSGPSRTPLLGETIGENLRRTVGLYPQHEALVVAHQGYRATYQQLWAQTTQLAKGLLALGVAAGERVGLWAPNRAEWVVTQFGAARAGAVLVNINPAYRAEELKYALNQSGCRVLLLAARFRQTDYVQLLASVRAECPALAHVIVLEEGWEGLLASGAAVPDAALAACEAALQFDDPINIQYTSGTTGFPKGATLSHHNILNNGYFIGQALRYTAADRVCIPVPFYHCFGMVIGNLACVAHGACMVVPAEAFDALATLRTVQAERCTSLYGVPTMFIAELAHPEFNSFDYSSLRTGVMAGSPCPEEVMKQVQTRLHMREVTICYGMTETSPVSAQSYLDDPLAKRVSTVGHVHPHLELKVIDPDTGHLVPRGTPGELCTRGYSVMLGYWNNPTATAAAIDAARWMHTGDLATIDAEGYLNIVGRIKDVILRGGDNIYPREVEEFLYTHPAVADVQVIGVPSLRYGEEVMAWVKLKEGQYATGEDIMVFCQNRIATNKIPVFWKFVDGFPMTVTGKIQKYLMREQAVAELGLQAAAAIKTA
ncbi:AMP-binding protein [Hymenobacter sp. H14-R3]|uniref:AMP-binding protein n=1 Tax=Hymenobacter sp. H14-R3 TaxID=3046308 RepID=UPI0024BA5A19|nr:AMP-binding protein [Hymenobacter sp. H14-R3]MDJ0365265.1 AMP-binding protein [Hymenobacter sp. H14-R3]